MSREFARIGISGGTFDPIHFGHLIVAEDIRQQFELDRIVFIPTGMPPHKKLSTVTDAEDRYKMVCMAVQSNPAFTVSRTEIDRQGFTYTVDTLTQLKKEYGDKTQLFFITGADVVHDLLTWREYERVFGMCEFIAALRPGYKKEDFIDKIENLRLNYGALIHTAEVPLIDISSTIIREHVNNGKSIKYLVPGNVEKYIIDKGLYRDSLNTD